MIFTVPTKIVLITKKREVIEHSIADHPDFISDFVEVSETLAICLVSRRIGIGSQFDRLVKVDYKSVVVLQLKIERQRKNDKIIIFDLKRDGQFVFVSLGIFRITETIHCNGRLLDCGMIVELSDIRRFDLTKPFLPGQPMEVEVIPESQI